MKGSGGLCSSVDMTSANTHWQQNCSEKPHPTISADLKFSNSKLAWRRMKVNEASCQQSLECCSLTSGHPESLQSTPHSAWCPGHQPGHVYQNYQTHGCQPENKMLTDSDSAPLHWLLVLKATVFIQQNWNTIDKWIWNQQNKNLSFFFLVVNCTNSKKTNEVSTDTPQTGKHRHPHTYTQRA